MGREEISDGLVDDSLHYTTHAARDTNWRKIRALIFRPRFVHWGDDNFSPVIRNIEQHTREKEKNTDNLDARKKPPRLISR